MELDIPTPRWAMPLLNPCRYKGAKGGRSGGKSHFFAEKVVEEMVYDKDIDVVCIREIQKSLKFSAKRLIENKIQQMGVGFLFEVLATEIRRKHGTGICIFQGMQDHTADSIKSLEGFKIAWVEEAQNLSYKSLKLLRPTIRSAGSELWFSWNPTFADDPVDVFFQNPPMNSVCVHVNYDQNPFNTQEVLDEVEHDQETDPDTFAHIWLGDYWNKSDSQILNGKWCIEEFEAQDHWSGAYTGADWGFSTDPTALVKCWIAPHLVWGSNCLYIEYEAVGYHVELNDLGDLFEQVPAARKYTIRGDNSRPETISHVAGMGFKCIAADKWAGSVEDGISFLRSFDKIIIHKRCIHTQREVRMYSYKIDKMTDDVLPDIIDKFNHCIDAIRYAIQPIIKKRFYGRTDKQKKEFKKAKRTTLAPRESEKSW